MCVRVEQTAVDLLVVRVVINLHRAICCRSPRQVQHRSSDIIHTFRVAHRAHSKQRAPAPLACLLDLYAGHALLHQSAVQIHFDMRPDASMDVIKSRLIL